MDTIKLESKDYEKLDNLINGLITETLEEIAEDKDSIKKSLKNSSEYSVDNAGWAYRNLSRGRIETNNKWLIDLLKIKHLFNKGE